MKKKLFIILFVIITIIVAISVLIPDNKDTASGILRLHILANSNSDFDQNLKLTVRDALLNKVNGMNPKTKEDAELYIFRNHTEIESFINDTIKQNGADYKCSIESGIFDFPDRNYGKKFYPAGKYEAVRIKLGEAKGENWWCVIFPPLCLSADAEPEEYEWGIFKLFGELFTPQKTEESE